MEGVQFYRLILRLIIALFFLYCNFQNCTVIVQLKVTILKSLNLKNLSGIFHYSLNLYRYTANLIKIWKVYNYADWILDFSMLYSFSIANFRNGGNLKKSKFIILLSGIFHYSLNMYMITANLLKIWKVSNYADWFLDFSILNSFSIVNFRIVQQLYNLRWEFKKV